MRPTPLTVSARLRMDAIRRALRRSCPRSVLEVGAGLGAMATWLAARYEYVGVEPDEASYAVASARLRRLGRGRVVLGDVHLLEDSGFDLVCAFEVLEHVADEAGELSAWRERLADAGWLLLSVPAHSKRFGPSDVAVGHYRRYDRERIGQLLRESGFEPESIEPWGVGLGHLLAVAHNALARSRPAPATREQGTAGSGRYLQPPSRGIALLNALTAAPFRLGQVAFRATDVGVGFVVLARRGP